MRAILVGAVGLAALLVKQTAAQRRPADPTGGLIKPHWIAPHVRYLASPLLRGRDTGTPGAELAAQYVAAEFGRLGLKPLGDSSFLLPVPLRQSTVVPGSASLELTTPDGRRTLVLGTDYLLHAGKNSNGVEASGGVVFVGYGVTAPEANYDDYAGLDVRGKFVAMVFGGPTTVPPDERGHYASLAVKDANARAHGAVGVITLLPAPGPAIEEKFGQLEGFGWVGPDSVAHAPFFETGVVVRLTDTGTDALFKAANRTTADVLTTLGKGPLSFSIDATLRLTASFAHQTVVVHNAAAVWEGRDPSLRAEYVVLSAHLDHVGVHAPVDGDSVYHGAIDNAGGTASVLATARAFTELPRPRRSVIFLAVTAEEKGILGSDYFVHHPPIPRSAMVANVNLDNFVMTAPTRDLMGYGARYSTLDTEVTAMLRRRGLAPSDDPLPAMTIFTRSDHYAFMRQGIPGVMFFAGRQSGKNGKDGVTVMREYFEGVHHTPNDRYERQPIDWAGAAVVYAEANLSLAYAVANRTIRPRWRGRYFFHAPGATLDQVGTNR